MIKAIAFDIGSVLVDPVDLMVLWNVSKECNLDYVFLKRRWSRCIDYLDRGEISITEFWHRMLEGTDVHVSDRKLRTFMTSEDIFQGVKWPIVNIARLLSKKYTVGVISNICQPHAIKNRRRGLFRGLSPVILSSEVGCIKPQTEIYRLFLKRAQTKPKETLFIDDMKKNVLGARRVGMHAVQFKSTLKLLKDLESYGISVDKHALSL